MASASQAGAATRPHGSLSHKTPGTGLGELKQTNVVGSYTSRGRPACAGRNRTTSRRMPSWR
jgi:hypothetical protein